MLRLYSVCLLLFYCLASGNVVAETHEDARYLQTDQFASLYDHAIIVDCRSRLEYDMLHIKNAVHIPSGTMVPEDLERLLHVAPHKPIVFYCNGAGCMKSHAAFVKAQEWGISNVYVYRPGVSEWVKEYSDRVLFKGQEIVGDPAEHFLPPEKYQEHCLSPYEFVAVSRQPKTVVFDIRDVEGRQDFPINFANVKYYPVDRVVKLIKTGSRKISRKKLLILDNCGTQSKWLQYVLEDSGVSDYYFLEGGVLNLRKMGLGKTGQK